MCTEFPSVQNATPGVGGWAVGFSDSSAKGFVGFPPKIWAIPAHPAAGQGCIPSHLSHLQG